LNNPWLKQGDSAKRRFNFPQTTVHDPPTSSDPPQRVHFDALEVKKKYIQAHSTNQELVRKQHSSSIRFEYGERGEWLKGQLLIGSLPHGIAIKHALSWV